MHVVRIRNTEDLQALRTDWDQLAQNMFQSWDWLMSWWKHYEATRDLYVLAVFEGDQVVGIAPWFLESTVTRGRTIQFLGSGEVCSDYLGILCQATDSQRVANAIADWLDCVSKNDEWDLVDLDGVSQNEKSILDLLEAMQQRNFTLHEREELSCWRIELPDTWEEYLSRLSKGGRRKLKTIVKNYVDTNRAHVQIATKSDFESLFDQFVELHQRRRNSLGEYGCFSESNFRSFLFDYVGQRVQDDSLLLSILKIDDTLAAANLGFVFDNTYHVYQTGMLPDMIQHQPGYVMNVLNILRADQRGYAAIDFLRGDEPYKAKLRAQPTPTLRHRIVAKHSLAQVLHRAWSTGSKIKHMGLPSLSNILSTDSEVNSDGKPVG